jgi:protein transport protein SEC31
VASQNQALDGEDFFSKAQTQPQVATFSLPKAPKWLERPVSASFGFGGRVVSVGLADSTKRSSKIRITPFEVDSSVGSATESFENALKEGNLRSICETRINSAQTDEEKADWKVIETLLSENPRKGLADHLGFEDETDEAADGLAKLELNKDEKEETNGVSETESRGSKAKKHKRLTSIFDTSADADSFLSDLAASKGARTNNPFQIYTGSESEADRRITRALLLGRFEQALDVALQEDRLSDAFMIAVCGGQKCIEKVQEAYFAKQSGGPNYLRLLASIVGKNLWDVVHNADLSNWKEVMATLCTFADEKEFPDLCETLGDRLEEQYRSSEDKALRKDASFCYLAGSKLEKVVGIWLDELREYEKEGIDRAADDSSFSVHVRALQNFIEKVTIFRQVTNYQDSELRKDSDWKLGILYDKYVEYADVAATHGRLDVAERYLSLVPDKHSEADVARNRVKLATRKAAPKTSQLPRTMSQPLSQPLSHPNIYHPPQPAFSGRQTPVHNPYAPVGAATPAAPVQNSNPYASFASSGYPQTGYQPPQSTKPPVGPPPQSFGPPPPGPSVPPPPRAFNQSPATVTTYTTASNLPAWNDLPEGFGAPKASSRRGTPSTAGVISTPFPGQPQPTGPMSPPIGLGSQKSPPPPPPKGAAPPRVMSPPSVGPPRSSSISSNPPAPVNAYAPPVQSPHTIPGMAVPPSIPRGPSPYNAPPTGAPPSNRYAPNPASSPQLQSRPPLAPPPQAGASGPYAPQQFQPPPPAASPYAPISTPSAAQHGPPQARPPSQASRPGTAQSAKKPAPAPPKYREFLPLASVQLTNSDCFAAPGDRSHIPANAMPIYEFLSADMQRVKTRAPTSFKAQVDDAERRLNILFDHLNNEDLLKPNTVADMVELARAMQARDYETAKNIHLDILTNRTDECGHWMVSRLSFPFEDVN